MNAHRPGPPDGTYQHVVLVGVDGSAGSDAAVAWAADEARRRQSKLLVIHACEAASYGLWTTTTLIRQGLRQLMQPVVDNAVAIARGIDPELRIQGKVVLASPGLALQRAGKRADLIVVGCSSKGAVGRALLGSVAQHVASQAHTPVVLVAPQTGGQRIDRIVLAMGDQARNGCAAEFAFREAELRGVPLRVVHAWHVPAIPTPGIPGELTHPAHLKALADAELAHALTGLRSRFPDVAVSAVVLETTPTAALGEVCKAADLLVLGQHRQSAVTPHSLGHVARAVLQTAICAVVIVGDSLLER